MDWFTSKLPEAIRPEEENVVIAVEPVAPPSDFALSADTDVRPLMVKPIKYDDVGMEAKDLLQEVAEFSEGLVVSMQKPIVEPPGSPPPPQGPGPHRNYQAQLTEKFKLHDPQTSSAQVGLQVSFKPPADALIWNYNTTTGHQGIYANSFGPLDCVAQWMDRPVGGTAVYANADYKLRNSILSTTFIRDQMWSLAYSQALWRGFHIGTKLKYNLGTRETSAAYNFHWGSPKKEVVVAGELDPTGSCKLSCVKRLNGVPDTSCCAVFDFSSQGASSVWLGFGREYMNMMKVRLAVNSLLHLKASIDTPVGRVMKAGYQCVYDPHSRTFKQGLQIDL
ncbi:hypothetical protein DIPPA_24731 [Diplonema papillatum]|nr:hypothetical protein DIPPA_24731 [Diplonema papillatum]